jgi:hypothetical protein
VERDLEQGDYGRVVEAIKQKFVCPVCPKAYDSQKEAVEKFFENHDVEDLDQLK